MLYRIVLNGNPPATGALAAAARSAPAFWIGCDGGCARMLEAGIAPDLAVGDFDSLPPGAIDAVRAKARSFVRVPAEGKDKTDFELALDFVLSRGDAQVVVAYGWSGGRADHLLSALGTFSDPRYLPLADRLRLTDADNEVFALRADSTRRFALKPDPEKKYVGFCAATALRNFALSGLKYQLPRVDAPAGKCWPSNEFRAGEPGFVSLDEGTVLAIFSRG